MKPEFIEQIQSRLRGIWHAFAHSFTRKPKAARQGGQAPDSPDNEEPDNVKQLQKDYWVSFYPKLSGHPRLQPCTPRAHHHAIYSIKHPGFELRATVDKRRKHLRVELHISGQNAIKYFNQLMEKRSEIEKELGFSPEWLELPEKRASRIRCYLENAPLEARYKWPEYQDWMTETLDIYYQVFHPRIRGLKDKDL